MLAAGTGWRISRSGSSWPGYHTSSWVCIGSVAGSADKFERPYGFIAVVRLPSKPRQAGNTAAAFPPQRWREGTPAFVLIAEKPNVPFSDVAGLEEAKGEIMLRMVLPLQYPEQAKRFGIRRGGGILLYGPPGTGKTLLAKAAAMEVDTPFFHIRPSDIMSAQVGQAEKNVQQLFQVLRREKRAVLFVDEIEALVPSRRWASTWFITDDETWICSNCGRKR